MQKKQSIKRKTFNTKRGVASLYVVIFTTLILSIISLSYVKIMLSDATQTTNSDLSQSAYDSALAGVEDAKLALLKYHDCISRGETAGGTSICAQIIKAMQDGIKDGSCDVVTNVLNRITGDQGETLVIENKDKSDNNNSMGLDQAYTCVKIREELKDYRTTLDKNERVRVIPLRTAHPNDVEYIKVAWYSAVNQTNTGNTIAVINPIGIDIYQTDITYTLGELSAANGNTGTDHVRLILNPVGGGGINSLTATEVLNYSDKSDNEFVNVNCSFANMDDRQHDGFACYATIGVPKPFQGGPRNQDSFFMRLSLPHGAPPTDISVTLCKASSAGAQDCFTPDISGERDDIGSSAIDFYGVQAMVDSTGRANDLFRRIETRIELVNNYYNFPEFEIQLDDSSNELKKKFWVMKNCWRLENGGVEDVDESEKKTKSECDNFGDA